MDITQYFGDFNEVLHNCIENSVNKMNLIHSVGLLRQTRVDGSKIILIGNGGSSAIAEHMAIDLTKNAGLKAMTVSGSPMITTYANDYGYERVFEKAIDAFADKGDILIAISSSGSSKNILNACRVAKEKGMKIITFSGFDKDNPLRTTGDVNIWVDSRAFGYVELIHNLLLHYINDAIIGSAEYFIKGLEKLNVG